MNKITQYYENYDEDSRLTMEKAKRLEFITTTTYLNQYMKEQTTVLELGAGTGVYAFYLAEQGFEVTATDLTPKHVEIMKEKLQTHPNVNMTIQEADATNLAAFHDEVFDNVICLGPMYHLITIEQQEKCISECLRVLKPGGLLAVAYISRYSVFPYLVKGDRKFLTESWVDRIVDEGYTSSQDEDCFWTDAYFHTPNDFVAFMNSFDTERLEHIATDGLGPLMSPIINDLTEEEYKAWVHYHLKTCMEPSVLGSSNHALYICRKNNA